MLIPTVIMTAVAFILLAIGHSKGEEQRVHGLNSGLKVVSQIAFSGVK